MCKKLIPLFLASVLAVSIVACGNNSESANTPTESISNIDTTSQNNLPDISPEDVEEYSTDFSSFSYNSAIYDIKTTEDLMARYYQIESDYIGDVDSDTYNTICAVIEHNNSFYDEVHNQDIEDYLKEFGSQLFNSHHDPIISSDFISTENFSEVQVTLEGNTKYYVKLLSLNPETSVMAVLRLCDYSDYYNDSLMEIYDSVTIKNFTDDYPLVTYNDIQTGKYNGQKVRIDAIVDKVNIDENDSDFALWYPNDNTYVFDSMNGDDNIIPVSSTSEFLNIKNGDVLRFATQIYDDGSFGTTTVLSSEIVGHKDINNIHNSFMENCSSINYDDLMRNPDNYTEIPMKISGSIFQVVEENDFSAEYLISTDSGYVYASWYDDKKNRGSRFLEGDSVTLYGTFSSLKTYNSLIKENTVPSISVIFMSLN